MGSGTITLRVLKPDPMPVADRDGQPYRETDTRTSGQNARDQRQLGQHAALPLPWREGYSRAVGG